MTLSDLGPGFHLIPLCAHTRRHTRWDGHATWQVQSIRKPRASYVAARRAYAVATCDPMAIQASIILRGVLADLRETQAFQA